MIISTDIQLKKAPPGVYKVSGAVGLYFKASAPGKGSFFYRFRLGDRRRELGLGSYAVASLAEARQLAQDAATLCRKGVDPIEARRRERAENIARARAAKPVTFAQMTEIYLNDNASGWKHRHARQTWLGPLKLYAFPVIGDIGLDEISVEHVLAVISKAEGGVEGRKETAKRCLARIGRVIDAARAKGLRQREFSNPADSRLISAIRPMKRKGARPHFRAVDLADAPKIFQELKARAETHGAIAAWCFMVLTAARPSEALQARWDEIDLDKRLWVVPAERMKSAREHIVPLSQAAVDILERQARIRTGDSVFPSRSGSPFVYDTFAIAPARAGIDACTPHGWRSVFKDWAGDIGEIPRDLAEAALAHILGSTEASYRRRTAVGKRREVMENYSRWLNGKGAEVIALSDHRAFARAASEIP
jgi:integrase